MPIVSMKDTDLSLEINEGEVLYDSLHDRGIVLPHGCLSGSCGACRVQILEGSCHLSRPGVVEQNTIEALREEFLITKGSEFLMNADIRLSCRAKVNGDIVFVPIK